MSINLKAPELRELKPRIMVCGVGGAGGNAVNNMIVSGLSGVDFIVANTDAQALTSSRAERIIQMGLQVTEGLGAPYPAHHDAWLQFPEFGGFQIDRHARLIALDARRRRLECVFAFTCALASGERL